jgi:DNA-binding response OmpR family regulator
LVKIPNGTSEQPAARIVVVSDDGQLRSLVCSLLNAHGYGNVASVDTSSVPAVTRRLAEWDVAIVDTSGFPGGGLRALQQAKNVSRATIAIFADKNGAAAPRELVAGTDVVLGKPFDPRELLLVIRGILDGQGDAAPQDATLSAGPITLSPLLNHATVATREIELTGVEARILRELMSNVNRSVTRERLMERASLRSPDARGLDTHVSRLRRKIGVDRRGRTPIRTVRGTGYLLVERWEPQ